jgi:hypothetical protein
MTQDSDSGDAAGDARPTTDGAALWGCAVKIGLIARAAIGKELAGTYIDAGALIGAGK